MGGNSSISIALISSFLILAMLSGCLGEKEKIIERAFIRNMPHLEKASIKGKVLYLNFEIDKKNLSGKFEMGGGLNTTVSVGECKGVNWGSGFEKLLNSYEKCSNTTTTVLCDVKKATIEESRLRYEVECNNLPKDIYIEIKSLIKYRLQEGETLLNVTQSFPFCEEHGKDVLCNINGSGVLQLPA
ncbi:MAG: hypothetical protein D6769_00880 [Methanobacteriota archaeon]|nr:MAG: hypothetical protein D6769_00880 [Euryarchaeota archaeon]